MSETKALNQFQELFIGLDYFKTNTAKETIKHDCNISDQCWNKWWRGDSWPNGRNIRRIVDIISNLKNATV